jgi:hypothetical protein
LEAKSSELLVNAFGGRLACSLVISDLTKDDLSYEGEGEGTVTVNATDFQRCLDSFKEEVNGEAEMIVATATDSEFTIARASDTEESQTLPLAVDAVAMPTLATEFEKEVKIERPVFLEGLKNSIWAVGFEDHKEHYMYVRLIADTDGVTFMGGTGGRFSIWVVPSSRVVTVAERTEMFFHKDQVPALQNILAGVEDDHVTIKQAVQSGDTPAQIVFEVEGFKITFVGFNPNVKWPNIEKAVKEKKPYSLLTKVGDWEFATKGLQATFNEDVKKAHDTHESDFEAKIDKGFIMLTAKTNMKAQRKVPIIEAKDTGGKNEGIEFHCSTPYIAEIFSKGDRNDEVFIQYHDNVEKPIFIVSKPKSMFGIDDTQRTLFFASMKKN